MQSLQKGATLQGGKYRIERVLGQGGFGITYLAENTMLDGKVAVKEFFFKEYCNRDGETSHVTIPTDGNREIVERFKAKFVKEARTLFKLDHPNIVRILDIFEENGTAYYVMDYIDGESLGELVKRRGALPEAEAIGYIREAGSALSYIHGRSLNHLDVKPGNLMKRRDNGKILIIDFGVAKQYDAATSEGTTTTPVGISHGYSPCEQYQKNGVQTFSPQSDVYALAATLFKLLTGITPPEAIVVQDEGIPFEELRAKGVSEAVIQAIDAAMQPRRKRTQSVAEFLSQLVGDDDEDTEIHVDPKDSKPARREKEVSPVRSTGTDDNAKPTPTPVPTPKPSPLKKYGIFVAGLLAGLLVFWLWPKDSQPVNPVEPKIQETTQPQSAVSITVTNSASSQSQTFTVAGVSFKIIRVEGGTFQMGASSSDSEAYDWEKPQHTVTLGDYYIGETEVTQALWTAVMGDNPSLWKGDNLPVEQVSWDDCRTFISKLNSLTGKNFRLPTEAEWEYAARGGRNSSGYKYSGSNTLGNVAWYTDNSGSQTHPVKTKQANELGLYDMTGNVWEWCQDRYGSYSSGSQTNPKGPTTGSSRVIRGGDCLNGAGNCRVSYRSLYTPGYRLSNLGLRLAL